MQVNMHEAKAKLSALVEQSLLGEEVIIAKAGKPLARIVKYEPLKEPCKIGMLKGRISITDDVFEGDEDIAAMFGASE